VRTNAFVSGVMKPTRDVQPFMTITSALGLNPYQTPVSCPLSYGYGGAMGPAQFIPSTWVLPDFNSRIQSALNISTMPNPWSPLDAFMASGIYLSDLGANSTSYTAQKNAACKYYSGQACGYARGNTSYGNSVLNLAYFNTNSIQSQIDSLQ
jgi:membrane-bound lytic murein transglycosylase B